MFYLYIGPTLVLYINLLNFLIHIHCIHRLHVFTLRKCILGFFLNLYFILISYICLVILMIVNILSFILLLLQFTCKHLRSLLRHVVSK